MCRAVIAAVVLAALALAPAAAAKEVTSVRVCGAESCFTTRDSALLVGLTGGGGIGKPPAHPRGAIRLTSRVTEPGHGVIARFTQWWVPGTQQVVGDDGGWLTLPQPVTDRIELVVGDLKPYGPEELGSSFADTSSHAAAPPPTTTDAAGSGDDGGGIDWLLIGGLCALAAVAAAGLMRLLRRPGGATP